MIVLRITRGIAAHFPVRKTEWLMLFPSFAMGAALVLQPAMFETSPSFGTLARWGDQSMWATVVLTCSLFRLFALVINGTFDNFRYSPHLRTVSSLIGLLFWSQFGLGFLVSALFGGGAWSAPVAYSTFALAELLNFYQSGSDIGRAQTRRGRYD